MLRYVAPGCTACLAQQQTAIPLGRQWREHPGFVDIDEPYDCGRCIGAQGVRYGFPPLLATNQLAWELYHALAGQQRVGMDVLGLDATSIPVIFEVYDIPHDEHRLLFEKLLIIDREVSTDRQRRREIENAQRKGRAQDSGNTRRLDVS